MSWLLIFYVLSFRNDQLIVQRFESEYRCNRALEEIQKVVPNGVRVQWEQAKCVNLSQMKD